MMSDNTVRPLKIGILSQQHMHAHSYAQALSADPRVHLAGIWDEDPAAAAALAATYMTRSFSSLDDLLGEQLDGAIIASENIFHRALTERAAKAGVAAVLCEKPLATNLDDANAMIAACDASGARLATAFPCRFSPVFQRLKAAVDSGKLGKVLAVRATNHGKCPFGWFVEKGKSGGGAIIDHTVHVADLNRVLLGSEAVEVYAETGNRMFGQEWEDSGFLTITYADGVFSTLDSSWSRPAKSFPTWGDVTMEIVGTEGVASMDMFRQGSVYYSERDGGAHMLGWGSNTDAGMIDEFLTLCAGGSPDKIADGRDGLKALEVALAAYESARTGRPVDL